MTRVNKVKGHHRAVRWLAHPGPVTKVEHNPGPLPHYPSWPEKQELGVQESSLHSSREFEGVLSPWGGGWVLSLPPWGRGEVTPSGLAK